MNEPIAEYLEITGYTQELVLSGLDKPAGIDVIDNRMIISEYQTGEIIIYDITNMPATELERINTGLNSVQGIKIGPDGRIWFVDGISDGVYKLETADLGLNELTYEINVYPNPSSGSFNVHVANQVEGIVEVSDVNGKIIATQSIDGHSAQLNLDVEPGMYFVNIVSGETRSETYKLTIK